MDERRQFFSRLLHDPRHIGAIAPSGAALARSMAARVAPEGDGYVLELGPGTGPVTRALLDRGVPANRLCLVERDATLHDRLRHRFPELTVLLGDAADLGELLQAGGIAPVRAVVSSLPLLAFPKALQQRILEACFAVMPRGPLIQFTYSPAAPISRARRQRFGIEVQRVGAVWRNLPPATVWRFTASR